MISVTASLLRTMPLPEDTGDSDKEARGLVLIVAGSGRVPGAAQLCAEAALRAGAGKVQAAVPEQIRVMVGVTCPEIAVIGMVETANGEPSASGMDAMESQLHGADSVLIGPGLMDEDTAADLTQALLGSADVQFVLDAGALPKLMDARALVCRQSKPCILTPHAGEMARLLNWDKARVMCEPIEAAAHAARTFHAVIVLKGATTYITGPDAELYCNRDGVTGLATGGSGDVLAGLIAALAARGCPPLQAALWGVHVHAMAGKRLSGRIGSFGFLGREIAGEFPAILDALGGITQKATP